MSDQQIIVQSVVRLPSPPPPNSSSSKRKRSPPSRSPSPRRYRSPPRLPSPRRYRSPPRSPSPRRYRSPPPRGPARRAPILPDVDPKRALERERQLAERLRETEAQVAVASASASASAAAAAVAVVAEKPKFDAKAEFEKLQSLRSGGTYIPPARLRALQAQITDKSSKEYQRMAWEALKKSINGLVNKVNTSNIKHIVPELFGENLIRGRGLYCRSIMKAQAASLPFTAIYAAMTAIVNTKLPQVGELLLNRLVVQFRKAFKRNDKAVCLSSTTFIAHLCNQQVAHEILVIEMLMLLLNKPTDDSVEIAVGLIREVGAHLEEMAPRANNAVFEQLRTILHEANIDKRVQYMIEVLFQVRKEKYKDNPPVRDELDLVEEDDQITHRTDLDDEIETGDSLNIFKFDPDWEEHEALYQKTKAEILGEGSDDDDDDDDDDDQDSSDDEDNQEKQEEKRLEIQDQSNTNLVNLRRTIYLTIMSSVDFEECCHKLMKINLPPGQEPELCSMVIECCSQERTYSKFYGLIGERFAKLNRLWTELFEESFRTYYDTIHRYETNRLRNIAKFFGHMLSSDALGWHVFSIIHLNEEETTASSRIFIKILFQDLGEAMGMKKLADRLRDPYLQEAFVTLFPKDTPRNTRFSINYFTSIGMGQITEDMREHLKVLAAQQQAAIEAANAAAAEAAAAAAANEDDSDSISSYSSYTGSSASSRSRSRSRSYSRDRRSYTYSRSPSRSRSVRSRSLSRSRSRSLSQSRPESRGRSASYDSRSTRSRSYSSSRSRSRTPRNKFVAGAAADERRGSRHPPPAKELAAPRRGRSFSRSPSRASSYSRSRSRPSSRSRSRSRPRSRPRSRLRSRLRSHSRSRSRPRGARREYSLPASPPARRDNKGRDRTASRIPSPPPRRARSPSRSRSRDRIRNRSRSHSRSRSPPARGRGGDKWAADGYRDRGDRGGRGRGRGDRQDDGDYRGRGGRGRRTRRDV